MWWKINIRIHLNYFVLIKSYFFIGKSRKNWCLTKRFPPCSQTTQSESIHLLQTCIFLICFLFYSTFFILKFFEYFKWWNNQCPHNSFDHSLLFLLSTGEIFGMKLPQTTQFDSEHFTQLLFRVCMLFRFNFSYDNLLPKIHTYWSKGNNFLPGKHDEIVIVFSSMKDFLFQILKWN